MRFKGRYECSEQFKGHLRRGSKDARLRSEERAYLDEEDRRRRFTASSWSSSMASRWRDGVLEDGNGVGLLMVGLVFLFFLLPTEKRRFKKPMSNRYS